MRYLRRFGEICVAHKGIKIQSKLEDKGKKCLFLGYAKNHTGDCYRLLDMRTNKVIKSRDIIWLNRFSTIKENETKDDSDLEGTSMRSIGGTSIKDTMMREENEEPDDNNNESNDSDNDENID